MGLFNNRNSQEQEDEDKNRKEQEGEQERQFNRRKIYVDSQSGIVCKFLYADPASIGDDLADADMSPEYKFMITEGEYVFLYNFQKYARYDQAQYERMLANEDRRLNRAEYRAELITTDCTLKQSEKFLGEVTVKQQPICISFKPSDGPDIVIAVENLNQDFSVLGTFMRDLGVKSYWNVLNFPKEVYSVSVINGEGFLAESSYVAFRKDGELFLIRDDGDDRENGKNDVNVCIARIDIKTIQYYRGEGSLRYEQDVSGGGGGGISYGGAILGGLLFGNVGAVIGSRKKTDEIRTKTVEHDDRVSVLAIKAHGTACRIGFSAGAEDVFDWLIPEKQYDYVILKRREMFEEQKDGG